MENMVACIETFTQPLAARIGMEIVRQTHFRTQLWIILVQADAIIAYECFKHLFCRTCR